MTKTITTEQLAALAAAIDAGAEQRGWNEGHVLVRVEADSGSEEGCQLGTRDLDGHPLESLLGFTAPDEWLALGVCCEGWGASLDSPDRPSRSKGRMRLRTTVLVTRDGAVASGLRVAGDEYKAMPEGEGTVLDALKRALGLPTAPPEAPFVEWAARMLFLQIIGDGGGPRRVGWPQLRPVLEGYEQITAEGTWEGLRQFSPRGHAIATGLSAEMAAWMDEGMFARWVLGGLPPYEHLLEKAKQATTPEAFTQVRRVLRSWGLRSRLRPAA